MSALFFYESASAFSYPRVVIRHDDSVGCLGSVEMDLWFRKILISVVSESTTMHDTNFDPVNWDFIC